MPLLAAAAKLLLERVGAFIISDYTVGRDKGSPHVLVGHGMPKVIFAPARD
jgi:hypothetical protein